MVTSLQLALFHNQAEERPELTDGYQGFNHLQTMTGKKSSYIIRDFETESLKIVKQSSKKLPTK